MNEISKYFLNVNMNFSHTGLRVMASKEGVDLDRLRPGEFALFVNAPFNAFKLFGHGNTFAYHRNRDNHRLNPRALMLAVERFDGSRVDYKSALAETIFKSLPPNVRNAIKRDWARQAIREAQAAQVQPIAEPDRLAAKLTRAKVAKRRRKGKR